MSRILDWLKMSYFKLAVRLNRDAQITRSDGAIITGEKQ